MERLGPEHEGDKAGSKLDLARATSEKMAKDLAIVCRELEERFGDIGQKVVRVKRFLGLEKVGYVLGRLGFRAAGDWARESRTARLEKTQVDEEIEEITAFARGTIEELGKSERAYLDDKKAYQDNIDENLRKYREAMPKFQAAKQERERFQAEIEMLERELKAGAIGENELPAKELELETVKRKHHEALTEENDMSEVVRKAQEAIPELQKNRDAAQQAIISIHGMRRSLLEKIENFSSILQNAMTAVRAQNRIEAFSNIDPAMNKTIEAVTENNLKTAQAAMDIMAQRLKTAAISPEESARMASELVNNIHQFLKDLESRESEARRGPRHWDTDPDAATPTNSLDGEAKDGQEAPRKDTSISNL
jgi:chromosome segregation ATPase